MSCKRNFFFFTTERSQNFTSTILFQVIRNSSRTRYENESSQSYRYINIINNFRFFGLPLVFHSGHNGVFRISRKTIRIGRLGLFGQKQGGEEAWGGREEGGGGKR